MRGAFGYGALSDRERPMADYDFAPNPVADAPAANCRFDGPVERSDQDLRAWFEQHQNELKQSTDVIAYSSSEFRIEP